MSAVLSQKKSCARCGRLEALDCAGKTVNDDTTISATSASNAFAATCDKCWGVAAVGKGGTGIPEDMRGGAGAAGAGEGCAESAMSTRGETSIALLVTSTVEDSTTKHN